MSTAAVAMPTLSNREYQGTAGKIIKKKKHLKNKLLNILLLLPS